MADRCIAYFFILFWVNATRIDKGEGFEDNPHFLRKTTDGVRNEGRDECFRSRDLLFLLSSILPPFSISSDWNQERAGSELRV